MMNCWQRAASTRISITASLSRRPEPSVSYKNATASATSADVGVADKLVQGPGLLLGPPRTAGKRLRLARRLCMGRETAR